MSDRFGELQLHHLGLQLVTLVLLLLGSFSELGVAARESAPHLLMGMVRPFGLELAMDLQSNTWSAATSCSPR